MINIEEIMQSIKNGVFTRFTFKSELPIKAEFKKQGYRIEKVSSMTVRFGINYSNIKSVKERNAEKVALVATTPVEDKKPRANNFVPVIKNKVYFNTNTGKTYVNAYPCKHGTNTKSKYIATLSTGEVVEWAKIPDVFKSIVQDSYWKPSEHKEMFRVSAENIIAIGNTGKEVI